MRRFTRLTDAFSKSFENHAYAVALHMTVLQFRPHGQTLRITRTMAAGLTDRLWSMEDIVALIARKKAPKRPPIYRKPSAA